MEKEKREEIEVAKLQHTEIKSPEQLNDHSSP